MSTDGWHILIDVRDLTELLQKQMKRRVPRSAQRPNGTFCDIWLDVGYTVNRIHDPSRLMPIKLAVLTEVKKT